MQILHLHNTSEKRALRSHTANGRRHARRDLDDVSDSGLVMPEASTRALRSRPLRKTRKLQQTSTRRGKLPAILQSLEDKIGRTQPHKTARGSTTGADKDALDPIEGQGRQNSRWTGTDASARPSPATVGASPAKGSGFMFKRNSFG